MGFLDIFSRKSGASALKKHATRVANKRAQNPDRWESIHALAKMGTAESVEALLGRFAIRVDPSITDQEEKDAAFHGILAAGEVAVEPVRQYLETSSTVSWGLKILGQLLDDEEVTTILIDLLAKMDVEYERDPQKKVQLLQIFEDRVHERVIDSVSPFLEDINETARFHTVGAVFNQTDPAPAREKLLAAFLEEESVRVRARIIDGFVARDWDFGDDHDAVRKLLPTGYAMDSKGKVRGT